MRFRVTTRSSVFPVEFRMATKGKKAIGREDSEKSACIPIQDNVSYHEHNERPFHVKVTRADFNAEYLMDPINEAINALLPIHRVDCHRLCTYAVRSVSLLTLG